MSWDVILMRVKPESVSVADLTENDLLNLGLVTDVLTAISSLYPTVDFSDPTWGRLEGADYSIEFNIGKGDVVDTIMLHVRGADGALAVIQSLCGALECRAFDTTFGDFIDVMNDPGKGFRQWRSFRDHVMATFGSAPPRAMSGSGGSDPPRTQDDSSASNETDGKRIQ